MALAASEFWAGIVEQQDDNEVQNKLNQVMQKVLVALLECCVMAKADKDADIPTKAGDSSIVEAKAVAGDSEDDGEDDDQVEESYMTLRKSSAYTLT